MKNGSHETQSNKTQSNKTHSNETGKVLEWILGPILRRGVVFAGLFLAIGWAGRLVNNGGKSFLESYSVYEQQTLLDSIHWALLVDDKSLLLSYIGLALLVALPVVRVLLVVFLFLKQKDYLMAGAALCVFCVLVGVFLLGVDF